MLRSKKFVRKTRSGAVQTITREHYLRDDIGCGVKSCSLCQHIDYEAVLVPPSDSPSSLSSMAHFLLPDTNVLLHQIDFIEDQVITNVIIPLIALQVHFSHYNNSVIHDFVLCLGNQTQKSWCLQACERRCQQRQQTVLCFRQ